MGRFFAFACLAVLVSACTAGNNKSTSVVTPAATSPVGVSAQVAGSAAPGSTVAGSPSQSGTAGSGVAYVLADPHFEALPGAKALFGTLDHATYQIEMPDKWNGDLVMYAHGFTGNDPVLFVQPPPLRAYFIAHGFAWAASSFSASGYAPDTGLVDTLALRNYFISSVAKPARTIMYGTSMGGHVVVSAMERYPQFFAGGFSECGVVAGVEEIDFIDSYVAVAGFLTATPLVPVTDVNAYRAAVRGQVLPELGSGASPTQAGRQFESVIDNLTGGPRPWRHQGYLDRRSGNFDLAATEDPGHPSVASRAGTNLTARYHIDPGLGIDDATLNGQVPRLPADPLARNAQTNPDYSPRTGKLQAPLLTMHTTGDHFVPISLEQSYRKTVDAAGAGDLLVQRAVRRPDHCQFSASERERGFADLVAWVENGVKPAGDDLTTGDLRDIGRSFTDPLLPGDPGDE